MFNDTYADRTGFDKTFLRPGKLAGRVFLPKMPPALAKQAAALTTDRKKTVLAYHRFSLVMHRTRRLAIYSAANVDFNGRYDMTRPKDVWRIDPRIDVAAQLTAAFYTHNQFDRGHLTRREDLEYGATPSEALACAADTCHWTNCTPQHARFNESAQLWQGLERHILEQAVDKNGFRAQVITGPILDPADPMMDGFPDTPYPLRYWKVVAAINASGALFATAYVLDQRGVIEQYGLRKLRGAPETPFTPFKTYQTTIAEVEHLTGLQFRGGKGRSAVPLSEFDPLTVKREVALRTRSGSPRNAAAAPYVELNQLDDVVLSTAGPAPG